MFDFNTIKDFDSHIRLSIPNYDQLFNTFLDIASIYSEPDTCVLDYGCSTGKFLLELPKKPRCSYFGIDESSLLPSAHKEVTFLMEDAINFGKTTKVNPSVVVSMFFLQFLGRNKRKEMISILKKHAESGAVILISEKVMLHDAKIDNIISRLHMNEKRKNFSDTEILDKDRQILDSMYILDEDHLVDELCTIGTPTRVWQSYNFVGYVVKKCDF